MKKVFLIFLIILLNSTKVLADSPDGITIENMSRMDCINFVRENKGTKNLSRSNFNISSYDPQQWGEVYPQRFSNAKHKKPKKSNCLTKVLDNISEDHIVFENMSIKDCIDFVRENERTWNIPYPWKHKPLNSNISSHDPPQWSEFCPPELLNAEYKKPKKLDYLLFIIFYDDLSVANKNNNYWVERKINFLNEVNNCQNNATSKEIEKCYQSIRDSEWDKNMQFIIREDKRELNREWGREWSKQEEIRREEEREWIREEEKRNPYVHYNQNY